MDDSKAKLLFMMMPFVVLVVAGAILILFASTTIWEEGRGRVFYTPLGIPGVLLILIGVGALALIKLRS